MAKTDANTAASSNWAGYAIATNKNAVNNVAGSWLVPTVNPNTNGYSSVWVGIDGCNSSTVEQIGTAEDVAGGKATYYAWYETYPSGPVTISDMTVKPGDAITASVAYNVGVGGFVLTIADTTESETFTTTLSARERPGLRLNGSLKRRPSTAASCPWPTLAR